MIFTSFWPLILLFTVPLLIMLYILKRKYKEEVISSSLLWREVYKNTKANTPWEKLRKNIMLFLQLIILLLIILALMKPFLNFGGESYKNIILVFDNTASMNTLYEYDKTRLDEAKNLAKELISGVSEETNTYIVTFNGENNLKLNGEFDKNKIEETIENIKPSYGTGDINEVMSFVKSIGQGINEEYEVAVFTDENVNLNDINGKVVGLSNSGVNGSIDNISHKYFEDEVRVIATITNRGSGNYNSDFSLYDGNELLEVETLHLEKGESITLSFTLDKINSSYLRGELSRKDLVVEDNIYNHVVSEDEVNKILIVTNQNVFLERAFSVLENTDIYKTNDVSNISNEDDYDLYIFDDVTPEVMPKKGNLLFINPSSNKYFKVLKGNEIGEVSVVNDNVSSYLKDAKFTLADYNTLEVPYYGQSFLESDGKSVGIKADVDGRNIAALSFKLHNSDFVLKKEFPILMYELGESLINNGMINKSNFKAGDEIIINGTFLEESLEISNPDGEKIEKYAGDKIISSESLGIYSIKNSNIDERFSINYPSEQESNTNISNLESSENILSSQNSLRRGLNIAPILIVLVILVVAIEWIMYKRGN